MGKSQFDEEFANPTAKYGELPSADLAQAYSGWHFLDRLMRGFIRASSKDQKRSEIDRLQTTRWALIGEKASGRSEVEDDSYPFMVMTSYYLLDKARAAKEPKFKPRSIRKLAEDVSKLDLVSGDMFANIERLRKKLADQKNSLIAAQDERNIEISTLQFLALEEIERILSIFGFDFWAED